MEPPADLPETPAAGIDLFLCPGLAFDRAGGRLGHGAGYYDRLLATAAPGAATFGVSFSNGVVPSVPMAGHDIRMDFLVTEAGICQAR